MLCAEMFDTWIGDLATCLFNSISDIEHVHLYLSMHIIGLDRNTGTQKLFHVVTAFPCNNYNCNQYHRESRAIVRSHD